MFVEENYVSFRYCATPRDRTLSARSLKENTKNRLFWGNVILYLPLQSLGKSVQKGDSIE